MPFKYKYDDLFNPLLTAMHDLGGSGSVGEIENQVAEVLNLDEDEMSDIHRGNITKLSYRLAWARNYLKRYGLLVNSSRAIWALTNDGIKTSKVDKNLVKRKVKGIDEENSKTSDTQSSPKNESIKEEREFKEIEWRNIALETLKKMKPEAFERLTQRLLREMGFSNVMVTGGSGDHGIDGHGIYRIGGVITYKIVFQCKRYKDVVGPDKVRELRGTVSGRGARGLLITTGKFTKNAVEEAQREGAIPIDLIDGADFTEKLKENGLGISVIEKVEVDENYFLDY